MQRSRRCPGSSWHSWRRAAYPDSWNLAGLKLRFLADDLARVAALRQQEIDWIADSGPSSLLDDPEVARHYRRHDSHLGMRIHAERALAEAEMAGLEEAAADARALMNEAQAREAAE